MKLSRMPCLALRISWLFVWLCVWALHPAISDADPFQQLVKESEAELAKKGGKLKISMDWPESDTKDVLPAFQKEFPFVKEIDYTRETGTGPFARYIIQIKQGNPPDYDIMHIASDFEAEYKKAGVFVRPKFDYRELGKNLPSGWPEFDVRTLDPEGYFIATTGNARGNAWNPKLVPQGKEPTAWESCLDPIWKGKIIFDARNKLQALQHDPKTREQHLKWLRALKANDVVLTRGQSAVLRKVASGEYPLTCGVNYHTAYRMIDQGVKTLTFAFPDPLPLEMGSRIFVMKWSQTPATTQLFSLWLTTGGQDALEKSAYRGFPWSRGSRKYPLAKGKYIALCDAECGAQVDKYNKEFGQILELPAAKGK